MDGINELYHLYEENCSAKRKTPNELVRRIYQFLMDDAER